ncbi:MAG: copper uptake system-associated protein [Nitrosomonadales bacterium]|nr:copper uptake system-associated protein [Nitrosomonadales bacterium]
MSALKNPLRLAVVLACALSASFALSDEATVTNEQQHIRTLISETFDRPNLQVKSEPVIVVGNHAVADWTQGENGGRALLRREKGKWKIMLCSGDGLKDAKVIEQADVPRDVATSLAQQLAKAEHDLPPEQIKRFGLFGATKNMLSQPHESGH